MAKKIQKPAGQKIKGVRPKIEPHALNERTGKNSDLKNGSLSSIPITSGSFHELHDSWLNNEKFNSAQRQALTSQIGQIQGNDHMQRVIKSLKHDEKIDPVQSPKVSEHQLFVDETLQNNTVDSEQTASGVFQHQHGGNDFPGMVQLVPESRMSLGASWFVEMTPGTPIIPVGTKVRFTLKNPQRVVTNMWEGTSGTPVFGVQERGKPSLERPSSYVMEPWALKQFTKPGHYKVYFRGTPRKGYTGFGKPLRVSIEFDVVRHLTSKTMQAPELKDTMREDIGRVERASGAEFVQAFKRIAIRRAIDIVNQNKMEALTLLRKYTPIAGGKRALIASQELQQVARLDQAISNKIDSLKYQTSYEEDPSEPWVRRKIKTPKKKVDWKQVKALELARASLLDAFPAIGLRSAKLYSYLKPKRAQNMIAWGLRNVMEDCTNTRRALATGKLEILEVTGVLGEVRKSLALDKKKAETLANAVSAHKTSGILKGLGAAGAAIGLLFIPGLGPYLSAAVGLADAAVEWKKAATLRAAAGAGVRKGIISSEAAATAQFWSMVGLLFSAFDVGGPIIKALGKAQKIKPHVPVSASRAVPASTAAELASKAPRASVGLEAAKTGIHKPIAREVSMTYLRRLLEETFGQKPGSWKDAITVHLDHESFLRARIDSGAKGRNILAFFDPNTGHIHISPKVTNLKEAFHEAIHKVCHQKNPHMRQLLGEFLHEGMTERLAQDLIGRPQGPKNWVYPEAVAFTALLEQKVGKSLVERAIKEGKFGELRSALASVLGHENTLLFFDIARKLSSYPKGWQKRRLRQLISLLSTGNLV